MPDLKISQLPSLTALGTANLFPIVASGTTQQISVANVNNYYSRVKTPTLTVAAVNANDTNHADYVCTGTNDHTTIQSAINALPSTGGKINLSEGTYSISGAITLPNSNIVIEGAGWATSLKAQTNMNANVISFAPSGGNTMKNITLRNFEIDANGNNQSSGAGNAIYALGAVFSHFENLHILTPYNYGLQLFTDNIGNFGHHNVITGCVVENGTQSAGQGVALYLNQSDENMVISNTFQANGAGSVPAHIIDTSGLNSIIGNQFVTGGIAISHKAGPYSKIIANSFDGCGSIDQFNSEYCQVHLGVAGDYVAYNTFYNIGFNGSGTNAVGLLIDNSTDIQVIGNKFMAFKNTVNARAGIDLDSYPPSNGVIIGNDFNNLSSNAGTAVWGSAAITNPPASVIIRDNLGFVTDNSGVGTIATGKTAGTVTHGLSYTPSLNDIMVTPQNLGSIATYTVGSPNATRFIITSNTDPGQNALFSWKIIR